MRPVRRRNYGGRGKFACTLVSSLGGPRDDATGGKKERASHSIPRSVLAVTSLARVVRLAASLRLAVSTAMSPFLESSTVARRIVL